MAKETYPWTEPSSRRPRARGPGWPGVAKCIVADYPDILPEPAPPATVWPCWTPLKLHRYREDGSLQINVAEGTWRDLRTGDGGGIFSLLARLLGSRAAARSWLRAHGYSEPLRLDPIAPPTEEERQFGEWYDEIRRNSTKPW